MKRILFLFTLFVASSSLAVDFSDSLTGFWMLNDNAGNSAVIDTLGTAQGTFQSTVNSNTSANSISGKLNGALEMKYNTEYISMGDKMDLGTGNFSMAFWYYPEESNWYNNDNAIQAKRASLGVVNSSTTYGGTLAFESSKVVSSTYTFTGFFDIALQGAGYGTCKLYVGKSTDTAKQYFYYYINTASADYFQYIDSAGTAHDLEGSLPASPVTRSFKICIDSTTATIDIFVNNVFVGNYPCFINEADYTDASMFSLYANVYQTNGTVRSTTDLSVLDDKPLISKMTLGGGAGYVGYELSLQPNNQFRFKFSDGTDATAFDEISDSIISTGTWHFLLLYVDRTNPSPTLYIDNTGGMFAGGSPTNGIDGIGDVDNSANFCLSYSTSTFKQTGGKLDNVMMFNKALVEAERDALWNGGAGTESYRDYTEPEWNFNLIMLE